MSYIIRHVELTGEITRIEIPEDVAGLALVLHRKGRPAGFIMEPVARGQRIEPEAIERWIQHRAMPGIIADGIREELGGSIAPNRLDVTIAICTKDHASLVERCLRQLIQVRTVTRHSDDIDILVVDNAPSNDATRELVERMDGVRYTCEPRPGLDFARNRAVREALGAWIAFLDDDVVVDPFWIEGLRHALHDNPDARAITGMVLPFELSTDAQVLFEQRGGFGRGFLRIRHTQDSPRTPLAPCSAGMFGAGCNMAFDRQTVVHLGGFDEALDTGRPLPGGGDLDMFYRVVRAGYPLAYEPLMTVYHQHRRTDEELRRQMWTWGLGMMAFVTKSFRLDRPMRPKFMLLIAVWLRYMVRLLLLTIVGRSPHPWKTDLAAAELAGGIVGLCGEYRRSVRRISAINERFSTCSHSLQPE